MHQSTLSLRLWETDVNAKINDRFNLQNQLNDVVVNKVNETIKKQDIIIEQQNALLKFK